MRNIDPPLQKGAMKEGGINEQGKSLVWEGWGLHE